MKRQFRAGQVAKREVRYLKKRHSEIQKFWVGKHLELRIDLEKDIKYYKGLYEMWRERSEFEGKSNQKLINHNVEQRAEIMKLTQANNQLENRIEDYEKSIELNEKLLFGLIEEENQEITNLKKELNKSSKWLGAVSVIGLVYVGVNIIGYFV